MTTHKTQLLAGASRAGLFPGASLSLMHRGPMIPHAPEDGTGGGGGEGDGGEGDPPAPVDPAAHARLVAAHERLKKDAKADRTALAELTARIEEIEGEKAKVEEEKAKASGDVEAVKAQLETKHARELKAVTDRAEKAESRIERLLIDQGLSTALDEARVKPELKEAASALLSVGVELKEEDGELVAYRNGLPLAEAIKLWSADDKGKPFILEGNSGGGAPGGKSSASGKNPWKQGETNLTEQDRIAARDPALASRLMAEAGVA